MSPGSPEALDQLFAVLADPTRRTLLQELVHGGPTTATRLAEHYPVSRQAVVKHLQTLVEADLVVTERSGREMYYRATPERLADVVAWLLDTNAQWDRRLERLRQRARGS